MCDLNHLLTLLIPLRKKSYKFIFFFTVPFNYTNNVKFIAVFDYIPVKQCATEMFRNIW